MLECYVSGRQNSKPLSQARCKIKNEHLSREAKSPSKRSLNSPFRNERHGSFLLHPDVQAAIHISLGLLSSEKFDTILNQVIIVN